MKECSVKKFVKMIFDGIKEEKSSKNRQNSIKNSLLVSFLILGLPAFIEFFLILNYHEANYRLVYYPSSYVIAKILELLAIFTSIYVLFVTVSSNLIRKITLFLWILILYIPINLNLICSRITGTLLSNDFMYAIFNTHFEEAWFVVREYFVFICINLVIVGCAFCLKPARQYWNKRYSICALMLFACSIFCSEVQSVNRIISAFLTHLEELKDIERFNKMPTDIKGIQTKYKGKETYVFVIGESVDRKHMGIYGYNRSTTPYFEQIKSELFIFKDVVTAHNFTSAAVKSMLLAKNRTDQIYSLISFFKSAGFKTFWLSNQGKWDSFDNAVMRFGKSCDEYAFIYGKDVIYSSNRYNLTFDNEQRRLNLWDENLLKYLDEALSDSSEKKLIILHLYGSHCPIDSRYPPEFAKFFVSQPYSDRAKAFTVCLYDNSILYTDHILNEVVKNLKRSGGVSAMLYLSDHGQDVNDTEECDIAARTWPNGYEVPFVVWLSKEYRQNNEEFIKGWNTNRKYVTDKTAYSLIDLARLSHPDIDLSNSIFSKK